MPQRLNMIRNHDKTFEKAEILPLLRSTCTLQTSPTHQLSHTAITLMLKIILLGYWNPTDYELEGKYIVSLFLPTPAEK